MRAVYAFIIFDNASDNIFTLPKVNNLNYLGYKLIFGTIRWYKIQTLLFFDL